jgi:hypothetical protein
LGNIRFKYLVFFANQNSPPLLSGLFKFKSPIRITLETLSEPEECPIKSKKNKKIKNCLLTYILGRRTKTDVPAVGLEVISISPECRQAISLAIARPKPMPPVALEREESAR